MKKSVLVLLGWAGLGAGAVSGQMVFEKSLVEVSVTPDQETITVEFPFVIKGQKAVKIAEYDAPCTCMEAEISDQGRLEWQPGEKGSVRGIFELNTFRGTVDKMIVLRMEGEETPSIQLTVRVHIPELLVIEPKALFWNQGEVPKPQSFTLKVNHTEPIHILETSGTNETFPFELRTIKEGREYEIVVTPATLEERAFGLIRIKTDSKYAKHASYQAFVVVRRAGSEAAVPAPGQ